MLDQTAVEVQFSFYYDGLTAIAPRAQQENNESEETDCSAKLQVTVALTPETEILDMLAIALKLKTVTLRHAGAMASPFPGMAPYLEMPDLWPEVHSRLIVAFADALDEQLSQRYRVAIEKRVYLSTPEDSLLVGIPDVSVAS